MTIPFALTSRPFRAAPAVGWAALAVLCLATAWSCLVLPPNEIMVLCCLLAAFTLIIIRYEWGLYPLFFLIPVNATYISIQLKNVWPFHIGPTMMDSVPLFALPMLLTFGAYLLSRWGGMQGAAPPNPLKLSLFSLIGYAALQLLWVVDPNHSLQQFLLLCLNVMLFMVILYAAKDIPAHRRLVWTFVLVGVSIGIIMFALFFLGHKDLMYRYEIDSGIVLDCNIKSGATLAGGRLRRGTSLTTSHESGLIGNMALAAAVGLLLTERNRRKRIVIWVIIAFLVAVNILGMSRGALGAMVFMILFLFATIASLKKRFLVLFTLFLIYFAGMMFAENLILSDLFLRGTTTPRVVEMLDRKSTSSENIAQQQAPGRIKIWKLGLAELRDTSFTGLGPGNFKYFIQAPHAHSIFFSFIYDFGLWGAGIIASIVLIVARSVRHALRRPETPATLMVIALSGGLVSTAIHGLVDFEYNTTSLWLFLGIFLAAVNITKHDLLPAQPEAARAGLGETAAAVAE